MTEFNLEDSRKQLEITVKEFLDQADFAKDALVV